MTSSSETRRQEQALAWAEKALANAIAKWSNPRVAKHQVLVELSRRYNIDVQSFVQQKLNLSYLSARELEKLA